MRKILYLIIVGLTIFLISCSKAEFHSTFYKDDESSLSSILTDENINNKADLSDITDSKLVSYNENEVIDNFIYSRNFYKFNDWIYYIDNHELRKCRSDLSENTLLSEDIYYFYFMDSILYFTDITEKGTTKIYKSELASDDFQPINIYELDDDHLYEVMIYKDNIIFESNNQLKIYNLNKDTEKIIVDENVNYFSIIDHYVYYSLQNEKFSNYIYRYEFNTEKSEIFYQFERDDKFTPKIYFRNRLIIIQTYMNSFIYFNIDDGILKNISFDISEYEQGWVAFYFTDEESNLFFSLAESHNVANPTTTPFSIFKVKSGNEDAELVYINEGENVGTVAGDYIYYFDYDKNLCRKENHFIKNKDTN